MLAHSLSNPGQVTQFAAQRFLASEVKTAARPRPYCQRTSSGSSRSAARIRSAVGRDWKAHIAVKRGRASRFPRRPESRPASRLRLHVLFHRRDAGMLLHIAQHDLLQPGRVVQEIRFALAPMCATFSRKARFTSCPNPTVEMVTWLATASLRQRHAVALFGDAVGQQHDVLVDGVASAGSSDRLRSERARSACRRRA